MTDIREIAPMPPFTTFDVEQRSEEWHALRAGLVTGSCAQAILQQRKRGSGELAIRRDLRHRLVCERLTGRSLDRTFRPSESMEHGIDAEPDAVAAYEVFSGRAVDRIGFIKHNVIKAGCSPDGIVGAFEGALECKCPDSTTHLEYLKAKVLPEEYFGQVVHTLWLTGAQWVDFVSFDPRFSGPLRLFVKRVHRAEIDVAAYELALTLFLSEVDAEVEAAAMLAAEVAVA